MKVDSFAPPITQVYCVYKTGGVYSPIYVERLKNAVERNCLNPVKFICLTDDQEFIKSGVCETIELRMRWPGWWSKIELFRDDLPHIPSVYFDLDTIILGNIDPLLILANVKPFVALRGFNHRFKAPGRMNFASGIMAGAFWEYSMVYRLFSLSPKMHMEKPQENWMHGDQGFIASVIGTNNVPRLQDFLHDDFIVGKKRINQVGGIPEETQVIAWSGEPRLHELSQRKERLYKQLNMLWEGK